MNRYKLFFFLIISLIIITFTTPIPTSAQSPADTQTLIKQLQEQIKALQAQVTELNAKLETTQKEATATKEEIKELKEEIKITRTLRRGIKGDEVKELQEFLSQFPDIYPEGQITGFFGLRTEIAVKKLQEKYGIQAIGVVGPKTITKINELLSEGAGKSGNIPQGLLTAPGIQPPIGASLAAGGKKLTTTTESISSYYSTSTPIIATTTTSSFYTATTTVATSTVAVPAISSTPIVQIQPSQTTTTLITTPTATTTTATTTSTLTAQSNPVTVISLSPTSGPNGTVVTLTGTRFYNASNPSYMDSLCFLTSPTACASAYVVPTSDTQIQFTVPSSTYLSAGTYNLNLQVYAGSSNLTQTFTVTTATTTTATTTTATTTTVSGGVVSAQISSSVVGGATITRGATNVSVASFSVTNSKTSQDSITAIKLVCQGCSDATTPDFTAVRVEVPDSSGTTTFTGVKSSTSFYDFTFGASGFLIPAGTTKTFTVKVDTSSASNSFQYSLNFYIEWRSASLYSGANITGLSLYVQPSSSLVWPITSSDTVAPSTPTNLTATVASSTQVVLSWTASTDNVSVVGYRIYRNSVQIGTVTNNVRFVDTNLPATTYSYAVVAYDAAGNVSAQSGSVSVTTPAATALGQNTRKEMLASISQSLNKILQTLTQLKAGLSE